MRTLHEAIDMLHRGGRPSQGLAEGDLRRLLGWAKDVLADLDRLHGKGRLHGDVCPAAISIGARGARLADRGTVRAPREYRDPDRERLVLRDVRTAEKGEPRHDLYGLGASLFAALDGGPPAVGGASPFTRAVPRAVAFVVYRAMADGPGRYPTAGTMRRDVKKLLRSGRRRGLDRVAPEDLPSFAGGDVARAPTLRAFRPPPERRRRPSVPLRIALLLGIVAAWFLFRGEAPRAAAARARLPALAPAPAVREPDLADLVAEWRDRVAERLRAAGESFDPVAVPLLVVSDLESVPDLPWPVHPSSSLARTVRRVLDDDTTAAEVQTALIAAVKTDTLPAVLWLVPAGTRGLVRARFYYRGLAWEDVVRR